ncbi:ANTAR domain-containing response regulator [Micrococcus sp.]|uniref:ANTAR domain-containing response regulator n=1 Tax=Micrococcus sp. TaxID=1271 RepID=UPI002A91FC14|nr:response regulator [Micrococcus sp.]MDY6054427.1 response regulator [Micrococcus sp.]
MTTAAAETPRLRAVVAEDEALIRLDIVEMLSGAGYDVVAEVGDGQAAVAAVREHRPDVVVMDVMMPVMDGIAAAQEVARERLAPVVMLTAFSQRDLVERARSAGAMAYVVKPFTEADVVPAIELAVARFDELRGLEAEVRDLGDRLETRKLVDRAKSLLESRMGLTEAEAFRWIQKTSMDRRLTMRQVAQAVVDQVGG